VQQLGKSLQRRLGERAQAMTMVDRKMLESQDIFQRIRDFFSM
jgi:hypothetical protein